MKNLSPTLQAFLQANRSYLMADLYTITLASGQALRWVDHDRDVTANGWTHSCSAAVLTRGRIRWVIGVEVDTLDLTIAPAASTLVGGQPLLAAAVAGAFDGAQLMLERAFLDASLSVVGTVIMFVGRFADVTVGRTAMSVRVNSPLEALAIKLPKNVYQTGCIHTLYDAGCGTSRAAQARAGTVAAGSSASSVLCGLTQAAGFFDRGYLEFTAGAMLGVRRTIKRSVPGSLVLLLPLPSVPAVGDAFSAYPGCDKSIATCSTKFANLANFRGYPFVPSPETAI